MNTGQQVPTDAESLQDGDAPVTDIGEVPVTRDARNGTFQFGSQRAMLSKEAGPSAESPSKVTGRKGHHVRGLHNGLASRDSRLLTGRRLVR